MTKILKVIPLQKGTQKEELTYFSIRNIPDGSIVNIPFRNREILGMVISSTDASKAKGSIKNLDFNLKKINSVKKNNVLRITLIEAILLTSKYFAQKSYLGFISLIPAVFKNEYDNISLYNSKKNQFKTNENVKFNIKSEKLLFQAPFNERILFYKTFIRSSFAKQKSVFMVLPTESEIKIFQEFLSKGIEQFTFAIHGRLSPKKQLTIIENIAKTEHPLFILGTAPFLSIFQDNLGVIILEKESKDSYRMITRPHFDLRTFVEIFASVNKTELILSDSLLRLETIARREIEGLSEIRPLYFRIPFQGEIQIKDTKIKKNTLLITRLNKLKKFKIFSEEIREKIKKTLLKNQNIFIFSLRKGLATYTICRDCSEIINCKICLNPLTLYTSKNNKKRMFICNRCSTSEEGEKTCNVCNSWNLIPLGIGSDTIYQELKEFIKSFSKEKNKKIKIIKVDKFTTKTKKEIKEAIKEFEGNKGSILIGTEMAIPHINKKNSLSIIASFDTLWYIPDFRMIEKILQIILALIDKTEDKLIIQTKNKNNNALLGIQKRNLLSFVRNELKDRKKLNYPPYKRFIKITHFGSKIESIKAKKYLEETFKEFKPVIFSGFHIKNKGEYITNALIKTELNEWPVPTSYPFSFKKDTLFLKLLDLNPSFEIFVDPENLL